VNAAEARMLRDDHLRLVAAAADAYDHLADDRSINPKTIVGLLHLATAHEHAAHQAADYLAAAERAGCPICATELPPYRRGRPPVYCSPACRAAAHRQRHRSVGSI